MTDEKWEQLTEIARKNFKNVSLHSEDLIVDTQDGARKEGAPQYQKTVQGTQDILEFTHPSGDRYQLVRENRPVVLEKKELYSHRGGATAQTQYKFSETEFSHKLRVYREVAYDEWEEITLDKLGLS